MGALFICVVIIELFAIACIIQDRVRKAVHLANDQLHAQNERVRLIWANSGAKTYPHELATGHIVWYSTDHDPMDV